MATHDAWALVCRLFAGGTPVLRATLSPRETSRLSVLGKAVRPTTVDQSFVLCPTASSIGRRSGATVGAVGLPLPGLWPVPSNRTTSRHWPGRGLAAAEMRLALDIESRDGIDDRRRRMAARRCPPVAGPAGPRSDAGAGKNRTAGSCAGGGRRHPRDHAEAEHDAWIAIRRGRGVAGAGRTIHVLAAGSRSSPPSPSATPAVADPATPVNGPFSADFKWATLPDGNGTPIRFTDGQAKVFERAVVVQGRSHDGGTGSCNARV